MLGFEIHIGQAEALAETFRPLEVIHQAPGMITANVGAIGDGASEGLKILAVIVDSALIVNDAARI